MKRIRVPEELVEEVRKVDIFKFSDSSFMSIGAEGIRKVLEAALLWLSENPQVLTHEKLAKMVNDLRSMNVSAWENETEWNRARYLCEEWQRRCFVQEEPEIPAEIEDLIWTKESEIEYGARVADMEAHNEQIFEAYRRGLRKQYGEQK